ncbi:MAG: type II toxin-antitoxin system HicA family toxin [Clostridia bacterium]|nr:type II toxin-antitoxin system HicA family toxin [Clostridia bacterium]
MTVSNHGNDIPVGTLRSIWKQAGTNPKDINNK